MRRKIIALTILVLAIIATGCASTPSGPLFEEATVKSGAALVYVYRPQRHYGKALEYPVLINGFHVADIGADGYFPLFLEEGTYTIQSDNISIDEKLDFNVNAGDVVYLRYTINMHDPFGFAVTHHFKKLSKDEAREEIQKCRLEMDRFHGYKK